MRLLKCRSSNNLAVQYSSTAGAVGLVGEVGPTKVQIFQQSQ